jgi:hypothetical protein
VRASDQGQALQVQRSKISEVNPCDTLAKIGLEENVHHSQATRARVYAAEFPCAGKLAVQNRLAESKVSEYVQTATDAEAFLLPNKTLLFRQYDVLFEEIQAIYEFVCVL